MDGSRRDEEAVERSVRDRGSTLRGKAWLAVLVAGLLLAAGLCYVVYRTFSAFLNQYAGE